MSNNVQVCPWPDCDETFPQDWRISADDERCTVFDENNVIRHKHLSSETAAAMGARGGVNATRKQEAARILKNAAHNPGDAAAQDAAIDLVLEGIAHQIVDGTLNSTSLNVLTQTITEAFTALKPPTHGKKCRLCGEIAGIRENVYHINLGIELVEKYVPHLADRIREIKKLTAY